MTTSSETSDEVYLTQEQVSARYSGNISPRTLSNWRSSGSGGPPFTKIGGKVLYPLSRLIEWEDKRTVASTSDYKG